MSGKYKLCVLALLLLAVSGCSLSLPRGDSGAIAFVPFVDEEQGIRGAAPPEGWAEGAALVQNAGPETMDELVAAIPEQTDLIALPRSVGRYTSPVLTWELYTFATQIKDVGPGVYRMDLALAEGDSRTYFVAMIAMPMQYEANAVLYEAVYKHALYALTPLE